MSEERGFEVVDKRRVGQADPSAAEAAAEPQGERPQPASPEEIDELLREAASAAAAEGAGDDGGDAGADFGGFNPFAGVTIPGILQMTASLLSERIWIDMGLTADPGTGQVTKNIEDAKRGIDALGDLSKHLEPYMNAQEKRELQTLLTNLRLNFVKQAG